MWKELSLFGCRLGWYFYCAHVQTARASVKVMNMIDTEPWEQTGYQSLKLRGKGSSQFVYFQSYFEKVHTRRSSDTK